MQLIAYTPLRPGAVVEFNFLKRLSRVLKYKVPPCCCIVAVVTMLSPLHEQDMRPSLLRNSLSDGDILALPVSATFLKGRRNKMEP